MHSVHNYPFVVVAFMNSLAAKQYHYRIGEDCPEFSKGDCLEIHTPSGTGIVHVIGFKFQSASATKYINVIEVLPNTTRIIDPIDKQEKGTSEMTTVSKATRSLKTSATTIKNTVVTAQRGMLVNTAIKTTLKESGILPVGAETLLDSKYGDLFVSLLLKTAADTFIDSKTIQDASADAMTVASFNLAGSFTQLQTMLETVITKALAKVGE